MRNHGTLKLKPPHINSVTVEIWKYFTLSSATINQKYFKKTYLLPLSMTYKGTTHQACLMGNQVTNRDKSDDIGLIAKAVITHIKME